MTPFLKSVLGLSNLPPADKVIKSQSIKDAMQSSGNFLASSMPITYPSIQTIITNLHNATVAASNGTTADTVFMHEQERILVSAFNFLKAHVEMVANNTTNPATIITSAGMQVAINGGNNAVSELTLNATGNGKLQVSVPRQTGEKAFVYEYSVDGGITWLELISSSLTKVTLSNQTPGSSISVRYYAISKTGKSAYSQIKSAIVV
jgi:hypothetical protein